MNAFIDFSQNDKFSSFKGTDLIELLMNIDNCLLEYRDTLNLPSNLTFGVEIEYEKLFRFFTDKFIKKNFNGWISKKDGSLLSGGEITSPIMIDDITYWKELKKICEYLSKRKADTFHNAGGHIHIGADYLGENMDSWRLFLKTYTAYENIILRFVYGDKINSRPDFNKYAYPVSSYLYKNIGNFNRETDVFNLKFLLPKSKRLAVNFSNINFSLIDKSVEKNTIEFRSPNATTNEIIWQNNINALAKLLVASKKKTIDEDLIDYRLKNNFSSYEKNSYIYNCIDLNNALEFADLVFDNNLDKVYFLRQYLKDFIEFMGTNPTIKAKKFTR